MGAKKKTAGRAETPEEKRETVEQILCAWERVPALRLGQFLANVAATTPGFNMFNAEDAALANACGAYVERVESIPRTQPGKGRD